jgi:NAD(P)H-nitrite reductase large subunit
MNYVIVGAGPAGTAAAEAIREGDGQGKITMISAEPIANYSKPLITYLLGKKIKREELAFREEDFYRTHAVELLLKKKATKLSVKRKEITLGGQEKISFDRLLLATGGVPIPLAIPGSELPGVFTFTQLEDADDLAKFLRSQKVQTAVVIGGGMIGLKATEALMERGVRVTLVELADRILAATFDRQASSIIEGALKKKGCQVFLQTTVTNILGGKSGRVEGVVLKNKKKIACEVVVLAIGVIPNVDLVKGTAIECDRGILVDGTMQTSERDIFAAGDCCAMRDFFGSAPRVIAIWPNAVRQGKVAGHNMAGQKDEYEGSLSMNAVELGGIPTISVGLTDPGEEGYEIIKSVNLKNSIYKKMVLQEEVMVGAIFIGDIDRAGIYTGLIRNRVKVTDFKEHLLKEDFGLIYLPQEFRKHLVTGEGLEV